MSKDDLEIEMEETESGDLEDLPQDLKEELLDSEGLERSPDQGSEQPEEDSKEDKIVLPDVVMKDMPDDMTPEMLELIRRVNNGTDQEVFQLRRKIRYRLFRIRDGGKVADQHDHGLKAYVEKQFGEGMNWSNFTFEWDVAPNNPLEVIHQSIHNYEWLDKGGSFDGADRRYPPAFTKQG